MKGFLFDENIPSRIRFTPTFPIISVSVLGPSPTDTKIWEFARDRDLIIVSKDADFSARIILRTPPPRVVRLRLGNMRKSQFHSLLARAWPNVETMLKTHKLVNVFADRVEGIH